MQPEEPSGGLTKQAFLVHYSAANNLRIGFGPSAVVRTPVKEFLTTAVVFALVGAGYVPNKSNLSSHLLSPIQQKPLHLVRSVMIRN
jgi:hypothetical protein